MSTTSAPDLVAQSPGATTLRVLDKTRVAVGVVRLRLTHPAGDRLPDWSPGAHIDVIMPADDGQTLTRQYSLCGDRRDAFVYDIAVLHEPGGRGGSDYVHQRLLVGDLVGVGGPRNNFHLVPAERFVFIAGGIGITPVLAMIRAAEAMGTPWTLLYGGRSRSSMAFAEELSSSYGDRVTIHPQDQLGLLDLAGTLRGASEGAKVYCCGPGPLLDALAELTRSWRPGSVRTERFVPMERGAPARSSAFEVELARRGQVVTVQPDESILEALTRTGAPVLSSCREGTCGTCETAVLEGEPDHRDSLLNEAERLRSECMFVCVSRSVGDRLVLDL